MDEANMRVEHMIQHESSDPFLNQVKTDSVNVFSVRSSFSLIRNLSKVRKIVGNDFKRLLGLRRKIFYIVGDI